MQDAGTGKVSDNTKATADSNRAAKKRGGSSTPKSAPASDPFKNLADLASSVADAGSREATFRSERGAPARDGGKYPDWVKDFAADRSGKPIGAETMRLLQAWGLRDADGNTTEAGFAAAKTGKAEAAETPEPTARPTSVAESVSKGKLSGGAGRLAGLTAQAATDAARRGRSPKAESEPEAKPKPTPRLPDRPSARKNSPLFDKLTRGTAPETSSEADQLLALERQGPSFRAASRAMDPDPFLAIDPDTGKVLSRGDASGTTVETPAADEDAAAARARREAALGINVDRKPDQREKIKKMSWNEYNALAPAQRAAVDFNTLLAQSVRRDERMADKGRYDDADRKSYDKKFEEIFGEKPGDVFVPETVNLLDKLDFQDHSANVEDFLNLKAAVSEDDLLNFATKTPMKMAGADDGNPLPEVDQTERHALQQTLVAKTQEFEDTLTRGNEIIQSFNSEALTSLSRSVERLGGVGRSVQPIPGFGRDERDQVFQAAFTAISQSDMADQLDANLKELYTDLGEEDFALFLDYADTVTSNGKRYGDPIGIKAGVEFRSPEEMRDALGLDR